MSFHDTDDCNRFLREEEDEKSIAFPASLPPHRPREIFSILMVGLGFSILFVLLITWTFQSLYLPAHDNTLEIIKSPCGQSSREAKDRGCHFDVLSFCWVPDQCFDRDLTEKFRKAGPWVFYTDQNKTASITEEQFGSDTQHVFLTNRLHKTHCAYNILRFHKALTEGRMVHREDVLTHTQHCTNVLTRVNDPEEIEVRAKIQYPDCGHFSRNFPGKAKDAALGHNHVH